MNKLAINLIVWSAACLCLPAAQADGENIFLSGRLLSEPCTLAVEDQQYELRFPGVVNKDLYINGRSLGRPIVLRLKDCDLNTGRSTVSISFDGTESITSPGLLVVESLEGLLIGLETLKGSALPLNKRHNMGTFVSGDNLISFNAYLQGEPEALKNRTLGLGEFKASLTFALSYE
jgi:type 1 fimbria pilin